ncbi:MAG: phosphoglycolate phosphatase [Gammaproteobacteria bacterium]|jgi:phosphoglycolate phosphatase
MPRPRNILFDLDGTLADTAVDLAGALNELLVEQGRPPLPFEQIRPVVSDGSPAMLGLAFGVKRGEPGFEQLRNRFLELYAADLSRGTRLFRGVEELLAALDGRRLPWGIVTNKPAALTAPLLSALALDIRSACVVSGDTLERNKPHPDPLLHACRLCAMEPGETVYVGDARRDVEAAHAAGMACVVAGYGYLGAGENPTDWNAEGIISEPGQLLDWLDRLAVA